MLSAFSPEFRRYRSMCEKAIAHLTWEQLRTPLDPETNSIAVIMKHVGGNLRSRWTDPLTTDGEKPWRNRDTEFIDDFESRDQLNAQWAAGWNVLESSLSSFAEADLPRQLTIRGEPHTLALALTRSLAHIAYHSGQIVQIARILASRSDTPWQTITVPRGGSQNYNRGLGYTPGA
jgi:hypothetical protein